MSDSDRYAHQNDNDFTAEAGDTSQADGMAADAELDGAFPGSEPRDHHSSRQRRQTFGQLASDGLDKTKELFDDMDADTVVRRAKGFLKDHPGAALLGVAAVGFLLGRSLKRNL